MARRFKAACHTPYFRPYTSTDVTGCELGGAVKNVIALAVGIASGMDLGDNAAAMLLTRGSAVATRLATAMGTDPATLAGLAGVGDLVATCSSPLSRNRTFGSHLGRGLSVQEAQPLPPGRPPRASRARRHSLLLRSRTMSGCRSRK
ncbi:Glycerol-3-phosphate dehydrogenase [NAD(P)+] [Streptomyces sp. ADI92-24]|nr:Glycerol-3-phosphate dehydrogenase [NAD(P)+] [Streptomyces sp. ADI92-24]